MPRNTKLNQLSKKRTLISNTLARFENFLTELDNDPEKIVTLTDRLNRFEGVLDEYSVIQSEIEEMSDDDPGSITENFNDRMQFENRYYDLLAKAKLKIKVVESEDDRLSNANSIGSNRSMNFNPSKNVRLPKISLPTFSSDANCWASFYDRFKSLIHDDQNLSISEKFFYLQSALSGEAAKLIEDLESTDVNYEIAWNLLKERYEDSKSLVKNHLQLIVDLPILVKESFTGLRNFLDTIQKNLRALNHLGEPVDKWDTLLLFLLVDKLDKTTKREWETKTNAVRSPSIDKFTEFLKERCSILKGISEKHSMQNKIVPKINNKTQSLSSTDSIRKLCIFCNNSDHWIYHCEKFLELDIQGRIDSIKKAKACTNCLRKGHMSPSCRYFACKTCNKKHNVLLHINTPNKDKKESKTTLNGTSENATIATIQIDQSSSLSMNSVTTVPNSFVFLSTAVIYILDYKNNPVRCRALLDSGSQSCFVTRELANRLKIPFQKVDVTVKGTNAVDAGNVNKAIYATIKSTSSPFSAKLPFLILKDITENIPQYTFSDVSINIPKKYNLADPSFRKSSKVDVLLGCSIFYELLLNNKIRLGEGLPTLQESHLGWIVSGSYDIEHKASVCLTSTLRSDIQDQLENFWKIEEVPLEDKPRYSKEEMECEQHFVQYHYRELDGRFGVKLPFRENLASLGESKEIAIRRFYNLEKKLNLNENLKSEYFKFINEYKALKHMTQIINQSNDSENFYLPHHCVLKSDSLTTKVRVVFDGSCNTTSGKSLNDVLMVGPKIQQDIFNILLRFRKNVVAFTADIEKMYRQINVHPDDCKKYQRILWRESVSEPLCEFELKTVTYGLGPSSFLATRCLKQLAIENENTHPEASNVIQRDFYMDDLISGTDSVEQAVLLITQIIKILNSGRFPLRQWISNKPEVLETLFIGTDVSQFLIKASDNTKTLGIYWQSKEDTFGYAVNKTEIKILSKRIILGIISQIFDILGLISPVIITAKILLQKLWSLHLGWDDKLPEDYAKSFFEFYDNIVYVNEIKISRLILLPQSNYFELHCFSDASTLAYGACIYILSKNSDGNSLVKLICAKSRVAPLKLVTLPRLELCAALLSAQLCNKVLNSLYMSFCRIFFWCDSTIVLAWINHDTSSLKTFVANRVGQIQDLTQSCYWRYVPTKLNPADLVSRGTDPLNLINTPLWWNGPPFLRNEDEWPSAPSDALVVPETKDIVSCVSLNEYTDFSLLERYSKYDHLVRVVAYILRFIHKIKNRPSTRIFSNLISSAEFENSKRALIKMAQYRSFKTEIQNLKNSKPLPTGSKILGLDPFLDIDGILRVGGRLRKANISYNKKHPIILGSNCHFTNLIIIHAHETSLHAGTQIVLANLRNEFWPMKGRQLVKKVIRTCFICFKAKPKNITQKMADLPIERISVSRAFHTVGIDYAGPYLIKDSKFRNKSGTLSWQKHGTESVGSSPGLPRKLPTPEPSHTAPVTPLHENNRRRSPVGSTSSRRPKASSTPQLLEASSSENKEWAEDTEQSVCRSTSSEIKNSEMRKQLSASSRETESVIQKFRKTFSLHFHHQRKSKIACEKDDMIPSPSPSLDLCDPSEEVSMPSHVPPPTATCRIDAPASPTPPRIPTLDDDVDDSAGEQQATSAASNASAEQKYKFGPLVWRNSKEKKKLTKAARNAKCNSGDSGIQIEIVTSCGGAGDSSESHDTDPSGDIDSPPVTRRRPHSTSKGSRPHSELLNQILIDKFKADLKQRAHAKHQQVRRTRSDLGGRRILNWDRSFVRMFSSPGPPNFQSRSQSPRKKPPDTPPNGVVLRNSSGLGRRGTLRRSLSQPLDIDKLSPLIRAKNGGIKFGFHMASDDERQGTSDDETMSDSESSLASLVERKKSLDMAIDEEMVILAEAVFDHIAIESEELAFRAGDVIEVLETANRDWWWGTTNGKSGWFPAQFVRLRVSQEDTVEDCLAAMAAGERTPSQIRRRTSISLLSNDQVRTSVVRELVHTERDFVKVLQDVVEGYIAECRKRTDMFTKEHIDAIFMNLEDILTFQLGFLKDLEGCIQWDSPYKSCVGACFLKHRLGFKMYSDYCNSHPIATATLQELYQFQNYNKFFEACRLMRGLIEIPLDGYLLTPIQRICKYPLQLAELLKYTKADHADYNNIKEALEAMRGVAMLINERKRRMESLEKLAAWQQRVEGWEDILKRSTYVYKGRFCLDTSEVIDVPDGKDAHLGVTVRHAIKLYSLIRDKWLLFCCRSSNDKQRWLKVFTGERKLVAQDKNDGLDFPPSTRHLARISARSKRRPPRKPRTGKNYKHDSGYMGSTLQLNSTSNNSLGRRVGTWFTFAHKKTRHQHSDVS